MLRFLILLTSALSVVVSSAPSSTLECGACMLIIGQLEAKIALVDPKKTIESGSYRVSPTGEQKGLQQIPLARSESHIIDLIENICDEAKNFKRVVNTLTGKAVYVHKDSTYLRGEEDGKLRAKLLHSCSDFIDDNEEEILKSFVIRLKELALRSTFMTNVDPIDDIDDLWKWKKKVKEKPEIREVLKNYERNNGPEVLICHDMKGGYLPEESADGCEFDSENQPYIFLNWWNIDIFCYFSHHFITIPPISYTELAHKHGCISIGTFITEWNPGLKICEKLLKNRESAVETVDALVNIAEHFGFDGWLINIENVVKEEQIENLCLFLRLLREKSEKRNPNSRIIWYDSVLQDGSLKWQNALNEKNKMFYEACHSIYLNYNWTENMLLDSADHGLLRDIFVGIDVFGRGCIGGFDSWKSFSTAKLLRMSVALFRPGMVVMGIKFWQKLYPYIRTRKLLHTNIDTNFSCGLSFKNGKKWFKLADIQLQPHCLSTDCYPVEEGLQIEQIGSYSLFNFSVTSSKLSQRIYKNRMFK
ncbi:unnamed protein product [Caenorhabditis auriculariae]|uniref:Uncharacterized protein n=1 Tax=Caenorhabditis auriculariae TaxID=2777116 RepID=A0A8S1HBU1_9PELO|nr:unnamed protein product [Caenorhabditis auriculariae]